MKKLALAAALSVAASTSFAGSYAEPPVDPIVIVDDTAGSSDGILLPLLLLVLVGAAVASS